MDLDLEKKDHYEEASKFAQEIHKLQGEEVGIRWRRCDSLRRIRSKVRADLLGIRSEVGEYLLGVDDLNMNIKKQQLRINLLKKMARSLRSIEKITQHVTM